MSDLVERLRKPVAKETHEGFYTKTTYAADPLCSEAAEEIERLQRELAEASSARDTKHHSLMVENSQLKASKDYWEKEAKSLRSKAVETQG